MKITTKDEKEYLEIEQPPRLEDKEMVQFSINNLEAEIEMLQKTLKEEQDKLKLFK